MNTRKTLGALFDRHGPGVLLLASRHTVASLVTLVAMPIVVTAVTPRDYGKFVTAMAVLGWALSFTVPITMNGVTVAAARDKDGTLVSVVRDRLLLATATTAGMLGAAYWVARAGDALLAGLIVAGAGYMLCGAAFLTFRAFLVGKRAFRELAPWDLALGALPSVAMAGAALATGNIIHIAAAGLAIQAVVSLAGYAWVRRRWGVGDAYRAGRIDRSVRGYGFRSMPLSMVSTLAVEGIAFVVAYVLGFEHLAVFAVAHRLFGRLSRIGVDVSRDALRAEFAARDERRAVAGVRRHLGSAALGLGILWAACLVAGVVFLAVSMPTAYGGAVLAYAIMSLGVPARMLQNVLTLIPGANLRAAAEAMPGSGCRRDHHPGCSGPRLLAGHHRRLHRDRHGLLDGPWGGLLVRWFLAIPETWRRGR